MYASTTKVIQFANVFITEYIVTAIITIFVPLFLFGILIRALKSKDLVDE